MHERVLDQVLERAGQLVGVPPHHGRLDPRRHDPPLRADVRPRDRLDNTQQLDRRYTAFGRIIDGMDTVKAIAAVPLENPKTGRPKDPPTHTTGGRRADDV